MMSTWVWPAIVLALVIVALALVFVAIQAARRRQSQQLQATFGPEYDRTVSQYGGQEERAEAELLSRKERVEALNIRPLTPEDRTRFTQAWRATQARFVDDPAGATVDADRLITDLLRVRGYPIGAFEQRAADISVNHPNVVANYRVAHATSLVNARGQASTEDLRMAMIRYRALYNELLETADTADTASDTERATERTEVG